MRRHLAAPRIRLITDRSISPPMALVPASIARTACSAKPTQLAALAGPAKSRGMDLAAAQHDVGAVLDRQNVAALGPISWALCAAAAAIDGTLTRALSKTA